MVSWLLGALVVVIILALVSALSMKRRSLRMKAGAGEAPSPPRAEGPKAPPLYTDENVMFTVYRPKVVAPGKWYTMLAFAHLSEKRPGAPPDAPDPVEEVKRQAKQSFGQQLDRQLSTEQQSAHAIPEKGLLTFVPRVEGIEFNPPSQNIHWLKDVHRVEFEMRASIESRPQGMRRGELTIFLGSLILAEVTLSIFVTGEAAAPEPGETPFVEESAQPYRKIFPSYSHKDTEIVEQFEDYVESLGDTYLRDVKTLRSGEEWDNRLQQLIKEASVFQLFWSSNSMQSEFVRREWEYALSLKRSNFIRPIYWEDPLPRLPEKGLPPEALSALHFYLLPAKAEGRRSVTPPAIPINSRRRSPGTRIALKMAAGVVITMFAALTAFFIMPYDLAVRNTNSNANANFPPINGNLNANTTITTNSNSNSSAPSTFRVSGLVRDSRGKPLEGVTISLRGVESAKVVTDATGKFSIANLPAGRRYVITPSKESCVFRPSARTISERRRDVEVNFTCVAVARPMPAQSPR